MGVAVEKPVKDKNSLRTRTCFRKGVPIFALVLYLSFLSWRMFFHAFSGYFRTAGNVVQYNLIPFKTIMNYVKGFHNYNFDVWVYNLFGNVAVFIPLGFLLPFALRRNRSIGKILLISFLIILIAETMQLVLRVGVLDVDDIILNLAGCSIGYMAFLLINKMFCKTSKETCL